MTHDDLTRARFAATADRLAALGEQRVGVLRERLTRLLAPRGDERALDAGTGAGPAALALAPLVAEVVGVDLVPELLAHARRAAAGVPNLTFVEGDLKRLPFEPESFELVLTVRTIHHVQWPEVALAELVRVCAVGGRLLVVDQIASADPLEALAHNRLERLRDPSHARVLSDQDLRGLLDVNDLTVRRVEVEREDVALDAYLERAGCEGAAKAAVLGEVEELLARRQTAGVRLRREGSGYGLTLTIAWYVAEKTRRAPLTTAT
ncbi:MAG: methyltransferase domain-containing protein [Thermoleophilia bacterium]|nr:methyltransferase domain-containing protein [Thermoleophilia bacterium]